MLSSGSAVAERADGALSAVYGPAAAAGLERGVSSSGPVMRIAVIIASAGRPEFIRPLVLRLTKQVLLPARVVVVTPTPHDNPLLDTTTPEAALPDDIGFAVESVVAKRGLSCQRNAGLDRVLGDCDVVVFFDDDYVPSVGALQGIVRAFEANPGIAGVSGVLLADGINGPGLSLEEAERLIDAHEASGEAGDAEGPDEGPDEAPRVLRDLSGLYGCNMAVRASAIGEIRFDERLPLYAWQEDIDFTARVPGRMARVSGFVGVHCGAKRGRERSGRKLGYSQIANPAYLARKGSMRPAVALRHSMRNFAANHLKALLPEPWIDRRGRALGNWIAIADLLRGRMEPERILDLE
ncbi:MAG: glycosyltransferase [Pseudomonadota bacterium]